MKVIGLVAAGEAFHEGHAFAFDRVGDQHLRPIGDGREMRERVANGGEVVAVRAAHLPAERAELVLDRPEIAHRGDGRIRLQLVVIDDRDDLRQPLVGARLQRFPDLPFLQLAVAGHQHDAPAAAGEAVRARHAVGLGDPHAERPGVGRDERRRLDVRDGPAGRRGAAADASDRSRACRARSAASTAPAHRAPSTRSRCRRRARRCSDPTSSSVQSHVIRSVELKLDPMWPEPACMIM